MEFTVDNKKIAKNTIVLYVRTVITMLISFFTARITLQILGSEDYGLNNLVGGVVSLFSFLNASMGTAVQRFYNIEMGRGNIEKLGRIYGVGIYLHLIVAGITFLFCEIFAIFFLSKMNIPSERMFAAHMVFQISIVSMVLHIVNVPNYALLKAHEEFSKIAIIEIIQAILRLVVLYLLYTISYDKLILYSLLNFAVSLFYVVAIFIYARDFPESHNKICRDKDLIKEMLSFISLLIITVLAEYGRKQGLVMLINIFFGLTINAAYAIAVQVSNIVNTFVTNIKQPIIPQMISAYGVGDKKSMLMLISFGTKITALMMLLLSLPIIFEIDYLLELWLKTPPEYSSKLVVLVLVNINISSFTYFLYQGVHATGNITKQQILMSLLYILNVLLIYVLFKLGYNFVSALYATIFISICQCILNLVLAKKYYDYSIKFFLRDSVLPCLVVTVLISFVLYGITIVINSSFLRLLLLGIVDLGLCFLLGYYIVLNRDEKIKAMSLVKRYFSRKSLKL